MAVRQLEQLYQPLPVGDLRGGVSLSSLEQELARVSAALADMAERASIGGAIVQGVPSSFVLDTTPKTIVNYGGGGASNRFLGSVDPVAGTITIDRPTTINVRAHVAGDQGNNAFNEAAVLGLDVGGTKRELATYEIPSNTKSGRTWNAGVTFAITAAPAVLSLELYATAGLGTFTFSSCSFEVEQLTLQVGS